MPVTCWIDRRRKSAALAPLAPNERLTLFSKVQGYLSPHTSPTSPNERVADLALTATHQQQQAVELV